MFVQEDVKLISISAARLESGLLNKSVVHLPVFLAPCLTICEHILLTRKLESRLGRSHFQRSSCFLTSVFLSFYTFFDAV